MKNKTLRNIGIVALLILVNILSSHYFVRMDFTAEKRYTLSTQSKELIKS